MTNGISRSALFADVRRGTRTFPCVAAVGFNLSKRGHVGRPGIWLRFVFRLLRVFRGDGSGTSPSFAAPPVGAATFAYVVLVGLRIGWVSLQSSRATSIASIRAVLHQLSSIPARCASR